MWLDLSPVTWVQADLFDTRNRAREAWLMRALDPASNYVVISGTATCNDQDIWDEARTGQQIGWMSIWHAGKRSRGY